MRLARSEHTKFGTMSRALALVLVVMAFAFVDGENAAVNECGGRLADKIIAINGNFLDKRAIKDLLQQCFVMYYKENKTLEEISDYFHGNFKSIDALTSTQVDQLTAAITNITACVGGAAKAEELRKEGQKLVLAYVAKDQAETDAVIAQKRKENADDDEVETAVCHKVFEQLTLPRKIELERKLWPLVPSECLETAKELASKFVKIHVVN